MYTFTSLTMRTLKPKTIFLFTTSSSSSFFSHLLSSHSPLKKGNFHFSSSSSSSWKHHDEESRTVRVSVWWDFENCQIPVGVNVVKVAQRITSAIRSNGIKGPITITAFGDVLQLSRSNQEALSSTGICLNHVPRGGKNSADRSLLIDLVYWVSQNPPPAHLLLISGDRDFANNLHRLRMSNYNILLASTESAPEVLCCAASIMWSWNNLVRGDSLTGKHFNQPPDGPYGSWYGHYKGSFLDMEQPASSKLENSADSSTDAKPRPLPKQLASSKLENSTDSSTDAKPRPLPKQLASSKLENSADSSTDAKPRPLPKQLASSKLENSTDSSTDAKPRPLPKQLASSKLENSADSSTDAKPRPLPKQLASSKLENSTDSSTDAKPRPLPKSLVYRMHQIVNEYPKGVDISEFRAELVKSSVLDKDFFGYKKFSHMLKSLPYVLKLQSTKDGGILVHGIQPKGVIKKIINNKK